VPLILLAQVLHQWTAYNNLGLLLTNKTKKFAWGSAVAIPSVILLNFLLIPRFGVWGAAIATIIAYILRFLVIQMHSQREYRIHYDWARIGKLYAILASAVIIRELFGELQILPSVAICIALAASALAGVYFYVISAKERTAVQGILHRRIEWQSLLRSFSRPTPPQRQPEETEEVAV
jgi:O-antigen/teichoic acid export membrane protein